MSDNNLFKQPPKINPFFEIFDTISNTYRKIDIRRIIGITYVYDSRRRRRSRKIGYINLHFDNLSWIRTTYSWYKRNIKRLVEDLYRDKPISLKIKRIRHRKLLDGSYSYRYTIDTDK